MIALARNWWKRIHLQNQAQIEEMEARLANAKQIARLANEAANVFVSDETLFDPLNFDTGDNLTPEDFQEIQKNSYRMWRTNILIHGWIELAVSFIAGSELHLKSLDEDPATQNCWNQYARADRFRLRAMEIVRRVLRDGECFIRVFPLPPVGENEQPNGGLTIRFLDPLRVKANPSRPQETRFGIETDPADINTVIRYWYDTTGRNDLIAIPAAEIIHVKRSDSDCLRGVPWLQPCFRQVRELEKIFFARQMLHRIRASVIIDQEIRGGPNVAQAAADTIKSSKEPNANLAVGGKAKTPPIGGIFIHNDNVKRTFQTPNLQAIDADADIRRHLLGCAVMMGWAEYAATADASNSNYASTMIAESPFVKTMLREQAFFSDAFERLHEKVIQRHIELKILAPLSRSTTRVIQRDKIVEEIKTVPRPTGANVCYPNLIHRDFLQETQALLLQRDAGAISLHTMQVKLELDPQEERLNQSIERLESPPTGASDATPNASLKNKGDPKIAGLDDSPAPNEPANRVKTRKRPTNR